MNDLKNRLRGEIDRTLKDLIPPGERFALLDFPNYDNIGDSAIYIGEIDFFADQHRRPSFVSERNNIDWVKMERAVGDGPILLQGGGNLGDIWPGFQLAREKVLDQYPGRHIVQLPQSLHFGSDEAADRFARTVERHGAFTLLVRDQPSFDYATARFSCEVRLCPDMAFAMRPLRRRPASCDVLLHLRIDKEAATTYDTEALEASGAFIRKDWPAENLGMMYREARRATKVAGLLSLTFDRSKLRVMLFERMARMRLDRGIDLLSTGRAVITDRLHGHILCCLLDIPHVALDNNYGKIRNFSAAWDTAGPRARLASSLDEAVEIAKAWKA